MKSTHDLPDDSGAFDVPSVRSKSHLGHLKQDPALHRLESIPGIGESAGIDDRIGVFKKRAAHLVCDIHIDDAPFA
jgi:hypothetical protein